MFERPIVIYSNYCTYSQSFMQALSEQPDIFESFIRLCIDVDISTGKRPDVFYIIQEQLQKRITKVPTVIINGGNVVLAGSEAFAWLSSIINESSKVNEPGAFAPNEMLGLSDSYSRFGSNDMTDASEKSFVFLNRQLDNIQTPDDDHVKITQQDYQRMQNERDSIGLPQQSGPPQQPNSFPVMPQKQQQMTRQLESFQNGPQKKEKDLDKKLEQLIMERNNIQPPQNSLRPPQTQQQQSKQGSFY